MSRSIDLYEGAHLVAEGALPIQHSCTDPTNAQMPTVFVAVADLITGAHYAEFGLFHWPCGNWGLLFHIFTTIVTHFYFRL